MVESRSEGAGSRASADPAEVEREPYRGAFPIVGVGASAGGLEAFTRLLEHLPLDTGMGFVLVQHLDPQHESALTKLLARATAMPVREVANDLTVEPNHVYVIPPNTSLRIEQGVLKLAPRSRARTPHRSIDHFFESLAHDQRECAIGVVLSGTASDGTLGLEAIKAEGGITFAQDDSARYDSMPRSAVAAGCVDFVMSPEDIAAELARVATHPYVMGKAAETPSRSAGRSSSSERTRAKRSQQGLEKILVLLRSHSGVDFSLYKPTTIERRINRRLVLNKLDTPEDYAQLLRGNPRELEALYSDALISVTSFFRNPEAFEVLQRDVLPKLLGQPTDDPVRVWVVGCSTGQEAYSIAMAYVEAAESVPRMRRLQVFATDLNQALLEKGRHGIYAKSVAQDLTPERLRRFFVEADGGYQISKALREMVVFARHDLTSDPPFSRIDLLSCRNLLIYLEPNLQRKVMPLFHYALKPDGFLMLGASESATGFAELFEPVSTRHKIYARKVSASQPLRLPIGREQSERLALRSASTGGSLRSAGDGGLGLAGLGVEADAQREADRVTVNQLAPPGVLVNAELQILQFRGSTSAYLESPSGKATFDVLRMARDGLMLPLRAAIEEARAENRPARADRVRIERDGAAREVNVEVIPLKNLPERCFLIVFEDAERMGRPAPARPRSAGRRAREGADSHRIAELESALAQTRDFLQSLQQQQEAANEALQASNEEVQSANEELQSINEELETSKEELESANEELTTVNEEMANRNAELGRLNSDLVNLQNSAQLAIVLLGRDLTIRRFSAAAERELNLRATDVGRPFRNIRHDLDVQDLDALLIEVIDGMREREQEVRGKHGRWFSLRVRPYMTLDNKVDGAILVLLDIDVLKRSELAIAGARDYAEGIVETVRDPLLVLDDGLRVESANRAYCRTFQTTSARTQGVPFFELDDRRWDVPELRAALEQLDPNGALEDFSVELELAELGRRSLLLNARWIRNSERAIERILLVMQDVTERRRFEEELYQTDRRRTEFLAMLAHELRNPLAPIRSSLDIVRRVAAPAPGSPVESALEMMERQVAQMVRLVDDLLDVSRITLGKIDLRIEQVELAPVVQSAVEAILPLCAGMRHQLTVELPPEPTYLNADPARLAQIVGNLLSNACKFTGDGGRIRLDVEVDASPPASVAIRVRDTGIGIDADQLPHVFDMFMQVDGALHRSRGGLGIGLALVKALVTLHDGTVEVHSPGLGRGSEFVVRLPIVVGIARPSPRPVRDATSAKPHRILVVDDNRDAAESLAALIEMDGSQTHIAYDGFEAVEAAAAFRPDVILLDIGLPGIDGYEVARRIRAQPSEGRLILVALSGFGQEGDRRRSEEAGFDAHVVKPVSMTALRELLAQWDDA